MCRDRGIGLERFRLMEVGLELEVRKVDKEEKDKVSRNLLGRRLFCGSFLNFFRLL